MSGSMPLRALLGLTGVGVPAAHAEHTDEDEAVPPEPRHTLTHPERRHGEANHIPLALDCCGNCKFFLGDPAGTQAGARLGTSDHPVNPLAGGPHGNCRRHPVSVRKTGKEWCGEFLRKPR